MMTKTIVALYDDLSTAERVIDNLIEAGFSRESISVMANDASGDYSGYLNRDQDMVIDGDVSAGEGAGFGAVVGGLIGVGVSLIPGIGPVLGAGPLAVALTAGIGAAAGAITGGVTAGLIDMGVDEDDAHIYAEGVRRGGTLISLTTNEEWAERAETIMNRYHPVDIDTRSSLWRERGWTAFDGSAPPYTRDQIEQERRAYGTQVGMGELPEEELYTDEERRTSLTPTHADTWAAHEAERVQREHDAKMSGAIPHSQQGATRSGDVAAGATPPGSERHHETSRGVGSAMGRDTSGSSAPDTNPTDTNNLNR
jgi:uncharacterized membrane protein